MSYDYDFSRHLSDNQFEWIVRDILQIKLDLELENFKDWKDWWIDIRYSENLENKIIIQCKKYKNFSSLKGNLKKEVLKINKIDWDFKYILATSVWLSDLNKKEIISIFSWIISDSKDIISEQDLNNLLWQEKYKSIRNKYRYLFIPPWEENEVLKIDYEISYKIEEINYWLDENIKKAKNEIKELEEKLTKLNNKIFLELPYYNAFVGVKNYNYNEKTNLENRIKKLEDYIKYLLEINESYLVFKKLILYMKNIWNLYDTNINIKIIKSFWDILWNEYENIENRLRTIIDYPEENWYWWDMKHIVYNASKIDKLPYRIKINDFHFELRELHINDEAEIFYAWEWLIIWKWDLKFDFEIKSKNTREIIKKSIEIKSF